MSLKTLSHLANRIPPIVIDAALATLLGVVGAAQVAGQRTPFHIEDRPFRPPVGLPPGVPNPPRGGPNASAPRGPANAPADPLAPLTRPMLSVPARTAWRLMALRMPRAM